MQFFGNGLGPQMSFRMHHVIMTLSENCNYTSKGQKSEENNTAVTGWTFSSLILFSFPSSSPLSGHSPSPTPILPIWLPVTGCPASCPSHPSLCFSWGLQCFSPTLRFMSYTCKHRTQCLNGRSGMMVYVWPNTSKMIHKTHFSTYHEESQFYRKANTLSLNKPVTCQCPGEDLLGVTNTQIKTLANMISLTQSVTTWCYPLALICSAKKGEHALGFFVCCFLTTANMASGFLVGGILNLKFFPPK